MKKLATLAAGLVAATALMAQPAPHSFSITPRIGFNTSMLTNNGYGRMYTVKTDDHTTHFVKADTDCGFGVAGGLEFGYQLTRRFGLTAGVIYSHQGAKREKAEGWSPAPFHIDDNSYLTLDYINVPVLANFYVWRGLAVKVGLQPGILLAAKDHLDVGGGGKSEDVTDHRTLDVKSRCNTIDLSIPVGVSYEFDSGIMFDARFNLGANDVFKHSKGSNIVLQMTVGYKFKMGGKR